MSKTPSSTQIRATTPTKPRTKILAPAGPRTQSQTGRSSQTATGFATRRPARKAPPAATANPAALTPTRGKSRAVPTAAESAVAVPVMRRPSKVASIAAMLGRPEGAAIIDLMASTGWQPHSVRAALTGLRKQGHTLTKEAGPTGGSVYRIAQDQPAKV